MEAAIRDGVQQELDRRKVGGGGGDDRLSRLEKDVEVLKATMVTKDWMERELGEIRRSMDKAPLTLLKWLGAIIASLGAITAIIYTLMKVNGAAS